MNRLALFAAAVLLAGCGPAPSPTPAPESHQLAVDTARLFSDDRALADDSMQGRRVGTPGNARARRYIVGQLERAGVRPLGGSYEAPFTFTGRAGDTTSHPGVNIVAVVRGTERPGRYIVVSGHYDHLGIGPAVNGDSIYNGADDDASGTAGVLELARWFAAHPPKTSMLFVAFDGEEAGLRGARAFVAQPPVPLDSIVIDVNLDMVGHHARNELYVSGTHQYPYLKPYVERVASTAPAKLLMGHDTPADTGENNWVNASDHGAFHAKGIPFLYFGVEDHPDYHQPSDEWRTVTPDLFAHAVQTVLDVVRLLDSELPSLIAQRR